VLHCTCTLTNIAEPHRARLDPKISADRRGRVGARQPYLDGELCGVFPDGITSFSMIQAASDAGNAAGLVFFIFDLLHLDGEDVSVRPLIERKTRLAALLHKHHRT